MQREELFRKYGIDESHSIWDDSIDTWMSIEIFRIMHGGKLPSPKDMSIKYVLDFLDKTKDILFMKDLMTRKEWGSLYLTAKRMVYRHGNDLTHIECPPCDKRQVLEHPLRKYIDEDFQQIMD